MSKTSTYDGSNAGKIILPLIHGTRAHLRVCSPFISPGYARLLRKKAEESITVQVITTEARENRNHQESLKILEGTEKSFIRPFSLFMMTGFLLAFLGVVTSQSLLTVIGFLLFMVGVCLAILGRRKHRMPNPVQLHISRQFIHSKMYIADDEDAVTGSANLTFSGLNRNVEHLDIFHGQEKVQPVIKSFRMLWTM